MEKKRVLLKIYGQVQGVGFRYYTQDLARRLKLKGWVKNEIDGTVTVAAEGKTKKLEELVSWCRNGSGTAAVEKVEVQWKKFEGNLERFEIQF
ncbi:MAG: acylphosphatase [Candidatus Kerfeldbacteria bacterium CG_4_10_14_0_8_um_filter_42_10]|uniref:Acylphosphatase n=1 Tax=Candidatus Kerfeldbacteria bacterium CG_4_10_14_0_8_um_filter_42_10 TaxID=2014248 RepID=A0A2M7RKL9_9BACT|nr:MAG: acylphosphatase [Candidatus Kerfeldbacteria bacterium CG_4_10_14_0_8_um_filter_42_10]